MTAGTGVEHSEKNPTDEPVHLYQIWILPERRGLTPSYEQKHFAADEKRDRLRLIASRDGREGSVTIHQDAEVLTGLLGEGVAVTHELRPGRGAWIQVVKGRVGLGESTLREGDGASVQDEPSVTLTAAEPSEVLLFDLA
jgi:redox-sensitive bicupin YhaK (pirin superfamily)